MSSSTPTSPNHYSNDLTPKIPENECWTIVPYTGGSNTAATSGDGNQPKNECLAMVEYVCEEAEPIRVGIPLIPTGLLNRRTRSKKAAITPEIIDQLNSGHLRTKLNRRPSWLPVGWIVWKVVRTAGKITGHVDMYYYSPKLKKRFRSKKEVFNHIYAKQRAKGVGDDQQSGKQTDIRRRGGLSAAGRSRTVHSIPAGVYVTEVGAFRPELLPMAPSRMVREFRIEDMLSGREV